MRVTLINHPEPVVCTKAASMCYNAKNGRKALDNAMTCGHDSLLEHMYFSFHIEGVSRVLLAQITRHRLASFSVQSQRYCGANLACVFPKTITDRPALMDKLDNVLLAVADFYNTAIADGVPAEDARYFTLQAGITQMVVTMNARELRHFLSLRCCNRAQWEIRNVADEMLRQARDVAPGLFDDAGPGCVRGRCPEGSRACGNPRKELIHHAT